MIINHLAGFFSKYKYHFLVWSIFIAYQILIQATYSGKFSAAKHYFPVYFFSLSLFYFHAHVVLKYTLNTPNKILKYSLGILIILEITGYLIIGSLVTKYLYTYEGPQKSLSHIFNKAYIIGRIWMAIYYMGTSTGYYFLMHHQQQKQLVEKMKQQELRTILLEKAIKNELVLTQNAFLRAQINPHFLINTLSFLYNETRKLAPKAAGDILSLADIIQYSLSKEVDAGFVELEKEIRLVESFLILYQAREPLKKQLSLSYNAAALAVPFIPMVLMSLTENMIRHGQLDNSLKPAKIKIIYEDSTLFIDTSNMKCTENLSTHETILESINGRLATVYGERAEFGFYLDPHNYFHTYTKVQF